MDDKLLLLDNDFLYNFAAIDYLEAVADILGFSPHSLRRLNSALQVFNKKASIDFPPPQDDRVRKACDQIQPLSAAPNRALAAFMTNIDAIDEGEQYLFTIGCTYRKSFVATCDRKALRALCSHPLGSPICDRLEGRVVLFESVLLKLISQYSYAAIRDACTALCAKRSNFNEYFLAGKAAKEECCERLRFSCDRAMNFGSGSIIFYLPHKST